MVCVCVCVCVGGVPLKPVSTKGLGMNEEMISDHKLQLICL